VWRRDAVLRQWLLHNPYYAEGMRVAERSDAEMEELAMRWAAAGARCVRDVLRPDGMAVLTVAAFEQRWPMLTGDAWAYAELKAAMPSEWHEAIGGAHDERAKQLETWWRDERAVYWRRWVEPPPNDKNPCRWLTQPYERRGTLLTPIAEAQPQGGDLTDCEECLVEPTARDAGQATMTGSEVERAWEEGAPRDIRMARDAAFTHTVAADDLGAAREPLSNLSLQPGGLLARQPVRCSALRSSHLRDMLTASHPVMPRAWDVASRHEHFAKLYSGLSHTSYVATMRSVLRGLRHHSIPPHIQDVLYKTFVSGHSIGDVKRKDERAQCRRCAETEARAETLEYG
jgi:hypothetical protein